MKFELREYQKEAVSASLRHLRGTHRPGVVVLPTGSGKSLVVANLCLELDAPTIVLQPSKEILEQNYQKLLSYDPYYSVGIFSASLNSKRIRKVTFAMIGSVINRKEIFNEFKYIIIDECHLVNPKGGMYDDFLNHLSHCRVIGLTATPYRLYSNRFGSELRFITRTIPRVFADVVYACQVQVLAQAGFLAPLKYYQVKGFDTRRLRVNSTGADYRDDSLKRYYKEIQFQNSIEGVTKRLINAGRKAVLVFTRFKEEADYLVSTIGPTAAIVTGDTPAPERKRLLEAFKAGKIKVVANVGVLTTGFDFPELDTVVMARPTKSLSLYYQIIGRAIRPHRDKPEGWIIDLCGNYDRFGRVEDLKVEKDAKGKWIVTGSNGQLTNKIIE